MPPEVSVATETLPGSQLGITIEVPPERVDEAYDRVLQRLSQRVRIEGFRPGRAPRALVEARLGAAAIREEVIDFLVPPLVLEALRQRSAEPIERPRVEVQELERGRPARLVARVTVWPQVHLPDLSSLRVERPRTAVDEEMVERRLTELRGRLAEVEPVDREARPGDVVVGDLRVTVDGEEVASEARSALELELREGEILPELLAALPGKRAGESALVEVTMPNDHPNPQLRSRRAQLELTVRAVKEKRLPELTDEVARELSGGAQQTAEELRRAVREDLERTAGWLDDRAFEEAALRAVVEAAEVEVPQALVEREMDRELRRLELRLANRGLRLDRYLAYLGKTLEQHRAELEPQARDAVKVDLVIGELARQLGLEPSEEEVTAHIRAQAEADPELRAGELEQSQSARAYFRRQLVHSRVMQALISRLEAGEGSAGPVGAGQAPEPLVDQPARPGAGGGEEEHVAG